MMTRRAVRRDPEPMQIKTMSGYPGWVVYAQDGSLLGFITERGTLKPARRGRHGTLARRRLEDARRQLWAAGTLREPKRRSPGSRRDPAASRSRRPTGSKTEAVRHLKAALRVAGRAEVTDMGTNPAFWNHVIRDVQRALENFQ